MRWVFPGDHLASGYTSAVIFFLLGCDAPGAWLTPGGNDFPETRIAASPAVLDFGDVSVNALQSLELSFIVDNLGEGSVTLTGHDEPIGDDRFEIQAQPLEVLSEGDQRTFLVRFSPQSEETAVAQIRIDPGSELIELRGVGRAPVAVTGTPATSATVLGCQSGGSLVITNQGSESLTIFDVSIAGADFLLTGWQADISAGASSVVGYVFAPAGSGNRGGTLTLTSNDPLHPQLAVNLSALGYEGERVEESFRFLPTAPTDILFAVEGALGENEDRLGPALEAYVEALRSTNVDFHVTAVSTSNPCPVDSPFWADAGDTALATTNVISRAFDQPGGSWNTDLIGLAVATLDHAAFGECLEGFRRETANLDVVLVGRTTPAVDVELAAATLADRLLDPGLLRMSALVPLSEECGAAGVEYAAIAETYGGAAGDLCDGEWIGGFAGFADLPTADTPVRFLLAEVPVISSLAVTVEGGDWSAWTFDAATNELVFDEDVRPALGAEVQVSYVSAVACED